MKVIIQCAGRKRDGAARLRGPSGEEVVFVARPELCPREGPRSVRYCRPDDRVGEGEPSWRDALVAYNRAGENPDGLLPAAELYRPKVYRDLVSAFGGENVFILSAGWGLIRSDFLTPDYNITFSAQKKVPVWARRSKRLSRPLLDLNHLALSGPSPGEPVHYFGGRDYLPLLHALTEGLATRVTVHHKGSPPASERFASQAFDTDRNQNWHYQAAEQFIRSRVAGK